MAPSSSEARISFQQQKRFLYAEILLVSVTSIYTFRFPTTNSPESNPFHTERKHWTLNKHTRKTYIQLLVSNLAFERGWYIIQIASALSDEKSILSFGAL